MRYVKEFIDRGKLGDIRYIYSERVNLGRIRNDVDALWNLAPHDISIIQYWLDDPAPVHVTRNGMDYVQKGIDDVVFMNIEYPDNIMANIHVSWLYPRKIRRMTVVGSEKILERVDKIAFAPPMELWLRSEPISELIENWFINSEPLSSSFIDVEKTRKIIKKYKNGSNRNCEVIWKTLFLESWLKVYQDRIEIN